MEDSEIDNLITQIAKKHLDIETLETRNSDGDDFYDIAVWSIKAALLEALNTNIKTCPHCGGLALYDSNTSFYWCQNGCPWGIV